MTLPAASTEPPADSKPDLQTSDKKEATNEENNPISTVDITQNEPETPHDQSVADDQNEDDQSEDDNVTVILLDNNENHHETSIWNGAATAAWLEQSPDEMEARRRQVLLRELRRVQRASFFHFALLCLIPTALLGIVLVTVFSEDDTCFSEVTTCELEPRTFMNAFTTRCVCEPIPVKMQNFLGDGY